MANTEHCSFVSSHYFICECGDNFPDEEQLQLHVEKTHNIKNEAAESQTVIKDEAEEYYEYYTEEEVPEQPQIILEDNTMGSNIIILKASGNPENMRFTYEGKEYYIKQEIREEQEEIVEETLEVPEEIPAPCREVVFRQDMIQLKEVVLDQVSREHDYDQEISKPEVKEFFFCDVCGKTFQSEKNVNMHLYRVHGVVRVTAAKEKKYKKPRNKKQCVCDVCGKHYASNAALRYHQRVHTGEKPYQCTLCPKAFTMPLFLQIHTRTHTGEKPYGCNECPKSFTNKAALLRHNRVHTGEKPYNCPECDKSFTQSNSMKLHVYTVHMKLPTPYKSVARRMRALRRKILVMKNEPDTQQTMQQDPDDYVVEETSYEDEENVYEETYIPSN